MNRVIKLINRFIDLYETGVAFNTILYDKYKEFLSVINGRFDSLLTRGCTSGGLEINDKPIHDYTKEELNDLLFILVHRLAKEEGNKSIIETLIETYGIYSYDDNCCTDCGDTVESYELNF